MVTLVGLGLTVGRPGSRAYALGTVACGAAFWLAGSRVALVAALIVALAAVARWILTRRPIGRRRLALAGLVLTAFGTVAIAALVGYPQRTLAKRDSAFGGVSVAFVRTERAVRNRADFVVTSLRMWATAPVFGVGAGRYYGLSAQFMGPEMKSRRQRRRLSPRENAHNNFLQIAAELGAIGLAGFLWVLAACGRRVWQAIRNRARPDPLLVGAGAGAAAFLLTCITGHPFLVAETAYPFWIVIGLALMRAHREIPPATVPARRQAFAAWTVILALVVTLPFRVDAAVRGMTSDEMNSRLGTLGSGMFNWEIEPPGGRRFRWSGPRATFFVPTDARSISIPLRATHLDPERGVVTVDVALGGRHVRRVSLRDHRWVNVQLKLAAPAPTGRHHRIDLRVDPAWSPAREMLSPDTRRLGVRIGELRISRAGPK